MKGYFGRLLTWIPFVLGLRMCFVDPAKYGNDPGVYTLQIVGRTSVAVIILFWVISWYRGKRRA